MSILTIFTNNDEPYEQVNLKHKTESFTIKCFEEIEIILNSRSVASLDEFELDEQDLLCDEMIYFYGLSDKIIMNNHLNQNLKLIESSLKKIVSNYLPFCDMVEIRQRTNETDNHCILINISFSSNKFGDKPVGFLASYDLEYRKVGGFMAN